MNKKFAIICAVFLGLILVAASTRAQTSSTDISGYAWSDTAGWINFNSNGGTFPYKVTIDSSGNFSGSAWSSNFGYLAFDRSLTGNPPSDDVGSGSGPIAKKDGSGNVTGWARFISACKGNYWNGTGCSGPGAGNVNGITSTSSSGDYWDGWVSLSRKAADSYNYGLSVDTNNNITGYAWGSNNTGWIWFNQSSPTCTGAACSPVQIGGLTVTCSASPTSTIIDATTRVAPAVRWTATVTGGSGPYQYKWFNDVLDASATSSANYIDAVYTSASSGKSATIRVTDSLSPKPNVQTALCSNTVTVTDAATPPAPTVSCVAPVNAHLCSSNSANGPVSVNAYGWCASSSVDPNACQAECKDATYVLRGSQCVKKSTVIEQ